MVKEKNIKIHIFLFTICLFFFTPFLIRPSLLTTKDNDLGRTYIPSYTFLKNSFLENKSLPLWRPSQLMGESYIANPTYAAYYPLNLFFLITPVESSAVIFYLIHTIISMFSTYYLSRSFSFTKPASVAAAIFYTFSIKTLLHISAGHITMLAAFSYFPLTLYLMRVSILKKSFLLTVLSGVPLSLTLILYPTIYYYSVIFLLIYIFYYFLSHRNQKIILLVPIAAIVLSILFSAYTLFPQLELMSLSSRSELILEDVAIPIWNKTKMVSSLIFPLLYIKELDHESFLFIGTFPIVLSVLAIIKLKFQKKLLLIFFAVATLAYTAGKSFVFFPFLYKYIPLLSYSRGTTRLWFVVILVSSLLSASYLSRIKNNILIYLIIAFFLLESIPFSYFKILSIPSLEYNHDYPSLKTFVNNNRIYCTTYCFNPQEIEKNKILLLNGENPVQVKKTLSLLETAGGYSYNKFAVIFPPYQVFKVDKKPIPNADKLAELGVSMVASTYEILDDKLSFYTKDNDLILYKVDNFKDKIRFNDVSRKSHIEKFAPNEIIISFDPSDTPSDMIVAESYYPGWYAHIDGKRYLVREKDGLRKINVPAFSSKVTLKYQPLSFRIGMVITISTLLLLCLYFWYKKTNSKWQK